MSGKPVFHLDIGPLGERHFTGISNVTKQFARQMLLDDSIEARFVFNRASIPPAMVGELINETGGDILWWYAGRTSEISCAPPGDAPTIGVFPTLKWNRRLFPFEVYILHDFTTVLTPEFHDDVSAQDWATRLPLDIGSSDLLVAVSESTRSDFLTYYPHLAGIPCIVAPLAAEAETPAAPDGLESKGLDARARDLKLQRSLRAKPHVVCLGTLEPRKNIESILEAIAEYPALLAACRIAFIGRFGWGAGVGEILAKYRLEAAVANGDLIFTGYLPDRMRDEMIRTAAALVYPSLYEGFGLPVAEGLSLGVPVITSWASSLPEAGGDAAIYCDFSSPAEIAEALADCVERRRAPTSRWTEASAGQASGLTESWTWRKHYETVRDAALKLYAEGTGR